MTKRKSPQDAAIRKKQKIWTIVCLIAVCVCAILLRSVFVYKLYPLKYQDEIARYSKEYAIDEYFVCAVVYTESHFRVDARSGKGAMGLMQIMPDTGTWAAQKIGIEEFEEDMLYDPDVNIRIGCWYLHYLTKVFDGDADKVLAAYNAGPSRVKGWLDDDGELREIPFKETEEYLEKVQRYYEIYKGIYKDFKENNND